MKKMKKHIIVFIIVMTCSKSIAQIGVIVPLTTGNPYEDIKNGTYIKDVTNVFGPYIGTWETTWQGKLFSLKLEKVTKLLNNHSNGYFFYHDKIIGKYTLTDIATGQILKTTMNITDPNKAFITSTFRPKSNKFDFIFIDDDLCSNGGDITLLGDPSSLQLTFYFTPDDSWDQRNCSYALKRDIPLPFPNVPVVLTKQ